MKKFLSLLLLFFCFNSFLTAQKKSKVRTIPIAYPSFEMAFDYNRKDTLVGLPFEWFDCGFAGESPPDVYRKDKQRFNVPVKPQDGNYFVGMVTRDNNTWEAMGQRLKYPLLPDTCYRFSLFACRSAQLNSLSRMTGNEVNYNQPTVLVVWSGSGYCKNEWMLGYQLVEDYAWKKFDFVFKPEKQAQYLSLEAYYVNKKIANGNLMIDNLSDIEPCDCGLLPKK